MPYRVSLFSHFAEVRSIGWILVGAYAYLVKKTSGQEINVSRLFIYYNARLQRVRSDRHISDKGCAISDGIEALKVFGTCLESIWPYDLTRLNKRPSDEAYAAAKSSRITDALKINADLHEMKSALAQGFPFIFGLYLFQSFDHARKKGIVPMPNAFENYHNSHGRFVICFSISQIMRDSFL